MTKEDKEFLEAAANTILVEVVMDEPDTEKLQQAFNDIARIVAPMSTGDAG